MSTTINNLNSQNLVNGILKGDLAILPTDTLYGIHASALNKDSVEKIYKIKKRSLNNPLIILISSLSDLKRFEINIDEKIEEFLNEKWPGKLSVILPCKSESFEYIHRGKKSLAFRIPDKINLKELIERTGPLVSTTVNIEGQKPATTINEARKIFKENVSYYIDVGKLESKPSTLLTVKNGEIITLREGAVKI